MTTKTQDAHSGNVHTSREARRLVVELNTKANSDLNWLVNLEELNKTTVVNRALQVYRMVIEAQANGGGITLHDPAKGPEQRLAII